MFWSSPSADWQINFFLLAVAFIIAIIVYFFKRKFFLSVFVFSLLGNIIFYFGVDYNLAKIYDVLWLNRLSLYYWPIINIILLAILIFNYRKNVKNKK